MSIVTWSLVQQTETSDQTIAHDGRTRVGAIELLKSLLLIAFDLKVHFPHKGHACFNVSIAAATRKVAT